MAGARRWCVHHADGHTGRAVHEREQAGFAEELLVELDPEIEARAREVPFLRQLSIAVMRPRRSA
ncbi:hypothetical protein BE15_31035 [Sorangium cellulosum]|uniref:Uncharacterized protein n=1 Tax=Sorangium cellulosum TaxID=56 RepID=A0A150QVJ2_SORCE|nr:hypothetical protein BE15_31035 [Sorangium cellulosum]